MSLTAHDLPLLQVLHSLHVGAILALGYSPATPPHYTCQRLSLCLFPHTILPCASHCRDLHISFCIHGYHTHTASFMSHYAFSALQATTTPRTRGITHTLCFSDHTSLHHTTRAVSSQEGVCNSLSHSKSDMHSLWPHLTYAFGPLGCIPHGGHTLYLVHLSLTTSHPTSHISLKCATFDSHMFPGWPCTTAHTLPLISHSLSHGSSHLCSSLSALHLSVGMVSSSCGGWLSPPLLTWIVPTH